MKKANYRTPGLFRAALPLLFVFAAAALLTLSGLRDASGAVDSEGLRAAQESVRRAVATCYSIESRYPESYEYLARHYGVSVDSEKYTVHYEVFASNIMPNITVVRR